MKVWFGWSVALSGELAFIGAPGEGLPGVTTGLVESPGLAYVFTRDGSGTWRQRARLLASDGSLGGRFGSALAVDGNVALVGAEGDDASYVFTDTGAGWIEHDKLTAGATFDGFGYAVALTPEFALVGAPFQSSSSGATVDGAAYLFEVPQDYGDAPQPYPTSHASDGARHRAGSLRLGERVDSEPDGAALGPGTGDDLADQDDEDGATFGALAAGAMGTVDVVSSGAGLVDAWIDFNADGDWDDAGEHALMGEPVVAGSQQLAFPVASGSVDGTTYARVRLSSSGISTPTGMAADGEVEDHPVAIAGDTVPDAFRFKDQTNRATGTNYTSNLVTLGGINAPAPISIAGGSYSVNAGPYVAGASTVRNGDTVRVRLRSSGEANTTTNATLTVGGVSDTFSVTTGSVDTTPAPFQFQDVTDVQPASVQASDVVTLTGFNAAVSIGVTAGAYRINGGSYTTAAGMAHPGDTVQVRRRASYEPDATVGVKLTVGGVGDTFHISTSAADINPEPFGFPTVYDVAQGMAVESAVVVPAGYDTSAPVSAGAGTEFRIDGGTWRTTSATIIPGQTIQVRHTSASAPMTERTTSVKIGLTTATFTTRTGQ
jgi:hypothetical protein